MHCLPGSRQGKEKSKRRSPESNAMYLLTGFDPGGRDVDFCCATNHVIILATTWTICLQCHQSTTRCSLLCQLLASSAQWARHHRDQRKEGAANSHHDLHVRRAVVLHALQWLLTNNKYYLSVHLNPDALALLPEDSNLLCLPHIVSNWCCWLQYCWLQYCIE